MEVQIQFLNIETCAGEKIGRNYPVGIAQGQPVQQRPSSMHVLNNALRAARLPGAITYVPPWDRT